MAGARFRAGLARRGGPLGIRLEQVAVNGEPGLLTFGRSGELLGALSIELDDEGGITGLRNQINPDKLRHLGEVGDLGALLRGNA